MACALATHDGHELGDVGAHAFDTALLAHWQFAFAVSGWVVFSLYWEIAAKSATAARHSEPKVSRGFHVFLTNAALLLEIVSIRRAGGAWLKMPRDQPKGHCSGLQGSAIKESHDQLAHGARHNASKQPWVSCSPTGPPCLLQGLSVVYGRNLSVFYPRGSCR